MKFDKVTSLFLLIGLTAASLPVVANNAYPQPHENPFLGSYEINNSAFGTVVSVTVDEEAGTRTIISNAIPNHTTGQFPGPSNPNAISEQNLSYTFTTTPVKTRTLTDRHMVGITYAGLIFEPQTNEWFVCETGEEYRIEAIQERFDLGLDMNNAHVQPNGEYHYHGIPEGVKEGEDSDLVFLGFAADGFLIYTSKSNAYTSGYTLKTSARRGTNCTYTKGGPTGGVFDMEATRNGVITDDWEFTGDDRTLDACNGAFIDGQYAYLVTNTFPFVPRCLLGEVEYEPSPPPPSQRKKGGREKR